MSPISWFRAGAASLMTSLDASKLMITSVPRDGWRNAYVGQLLLIPLSSLGEMGAEK